MTFPMVWTTLVCLIFAALAAMPLTAQRIMTTAAGSPLLPPKEVEAERRLAVGRRKYRPAEGKMLINPALPLPYRFTGIFAGAGFTGVVALTNRTHTDYDALIKQVEKHLVTSNE